MHAPEQCLPPGLRHLGGDLLDHCENVAWDPFTDTAVAGGEAGQVYRISLDGAVDEITRISGAFLLGLVVDRSGAIYACDVRGGRVYRIAPDGSTEAFGPHIPRANYPAFAADGTLYVSQEGTHGHHDGGIVALDASGSPTPVRLSRPLAFGNALLVEGDHLVVAESDGQRVSRVARDGGDLECVVELPGTVPDGLARDAGGGLWVSCYQPNHIYRVDDAGASAIVANDVLGWDLPMPTGICFGGPTLTTVLVACLGGWALAAFESTVAGSPLEHLQPSKGAQA